ncbi:hypothetical protein [Paractinoplanes brasiliensis]|uniref:Uncharacterized protein n=1 Tax=Paractinoplanes brasiliensis TaxID=52695 RepID=A0A4R6JUD9_9ACTN|nr:hypothetical protein [Actinoplanes brasiliensis]TDO40314.1 hypothetical protein C8E87_4026 [Actinoplanes brasiliensis]GID25380.1 hypothetical protein Abr02nite_03630 [Actinoplanes brasiliensis]
MRRAGRYAVVGAVLVVSGVLGTYLAYANWSLPASAVKVTMKAAQMPRGVKPSVAKQSGAAVVSWSAQEIAAGVKMDRYTVTAHRQDKPAESAIVREVTASGGPTESVIFTPAQVEGGVWRWTVTPHFASWTGAAGGLSNRLTFDPAPAAKLVNAPVPTTGVTTIPAPTPSVVSTSKPATTRSAAPVEAPPKEEAITTPPPVSSPVGQEPPVKGPGPSASGSAPADIPQ